MRLWAKIAIGAAGAFVAIGVIAVATGPSTPPTVTAAPVVSAAPVPDPVTSSPPQPVAVQPPAPAAAAQVVVPDGQHICHVNSGHGIYYLLIHSAYAHNYTACGDGPEAFGSNIDTMLAAPGMDRRCFLPDLPDATIAVYADSGAQDLSAAKSYCDDLGGTN